MSECQEIRDPGSALKKTVYNRFVSYGRAYFVLLIILGITFMLNIGLGSVRIPLDEMINMISGNEVTEVFTSIVFEIRLPRALATIAGGAALAVAGLLLQVFFRNAIVEPFVLGISSGATLVVGLVLLAGITLGFSVINPLFLFMAAFLGSMAVMLITVAIARKVRSMITLLVVGLMIGYIAAAATTVLITLARQEQVRGFVLWTMGSFSGATWDQLTILISVSVTMLLFAFLMAKPLNAFLLGEDYAQSMGVAIKPFRIAIIVISSLLSGVATAFAGPVAFIGLAVPHIARLVFGTSDNRIIVPACVLMGAILTGLCDLAARLVLAPVELPISAVTSFIGAPIVIVLLLKRRNII